MPKVKQETIKRISEMGMAKALQHANDNDDPEFREAVKRYYPNAKYGPKTKAAAQAITASDQKYPRQAAAPAKVQEDSPNWDWRTMGNKKRGLGPTIMGAKPIQNAVKRRVEPEVRVAPAAKPKSMRGVNQHKGILPGAPAGVKMWPGGKGEGVVRDASKTRMWPSLGGSKESKEKRKKVQAGRAGAAAAYRASRK